MAVFPSLVEERVLSFKCHPKQYNSQREDIYLRVPLLLLRDLWCHVNRRSFDG